MSYGYQNRRICAVQAFCAAKSWRRWDSLPPSILITPGLSRLRRVKQKTRRVARHKRFRCAKTLVHKQFICLCAVKCPTDTKKKSTAKRCSSFWWTWRDSNPRPYGCEPYALPNGSLICPKNHPKIDTHTQNFATKTRKMYMASFHS